MLNELYIQNFALIDEIFISFDENLSILTGETGAGKSIILSAASFILGGKANTNFIKEGTNESTISASFNYSKNKNLKKIIDKILNKKGIEICDSLLIKRVFSKNNKNKIYINNSFSTLSSLTEIGTHLIDFISQDNHEFILDKKNHLLLLDSSTNLEDQKKDYQKDFFDLKNISSQIEILSNGIKEKKEQLEFLKFQQDELINANLKLGEEEELTKLRNKLINLKKIKDDCFYTYSNLYSKENSIVENLEKIKDKISYLAKFEKDFISYSTEIDNITSVLKDLSFVARDFVNTNDLDESNLDEIENRLSLFFELKRKYGLPINEVIKKRDQLEKDIQSISINEEKLEKLKTIFSKLNDKVLTLAHSLSVCRNKSKHKLEKLVNNELEQLAMKGITFGVNIESINVNKNALNLSSDGMDKVTFEISTSQEGSFKDLTDIASGGELSRMLLALKTSINVNNQFVGTAIFDEIDAGTGGSQAERIGNKLRDLSKQMQVICITHLPQIACYADSHYIVTKNKINKKMKIEIKKMDKKENVIEEISRMLGGTTITKKTSEHATEMYDSIKRKK